MSMKTKRAVSEKQKQALNIVWGGKCAAFRFDPAEFGRKLHIDHVVPLAEGGSNDFGNLLPIMDKFNLFKSATRFPKEMEQSFLFLAAGRRNEVERVHAKLTHKPTPIPSMKRVKESQREQIIDNLIPTARWDLEKTKALVNGWLTGGMNFIKYHAMEFSKTYRQCVMKLTNLCLYDKDFQGIKTA